MNGMMDMLEVLEWTGYGYMVCWEETKRDFKGRFMSDELRGYVL
jgi:hypothetical protein